MRRKTKKIFLVLIIIIAGLIGVRTWHQNSWKTYRDEVNSFEIKLPRRWAKATNWPGTEERLVRQGREYVHFWNRRDRKWGRHKTLGILISHSPLEIERGLPLLSHQEKEIRSIIVDGIPAEKEIRRANKDKKIETTEIYFEKNGKYYGIYFSSQQSRPKDFDLFDKIVSSFKFIESKPGD